MAKNVDIVSVLAMKKNWFRQMLIFMGPTWGPKKRQPVPLEVNRKNPVRGD